MDRTNKLFGLVTHHLCKNPRKFEEKHISLFNRLTLSSAAIEEKSDLGHTAIECFRSGRHMIETCPKVSCLAAQNCFMLFKEPGSFKKI
jgi:hypothetical protein